jgi:hypothetical protein
LAKERSHSSLLQIKTTDIRAVQIQPVSFAFTLLLGFLAIVPYSGIDINLAALAGDWLRLACSDIGLMMSAFMLRPRRAATKAVVAELRPLVKLEWLFRLQCQLHEHQTETGYEQRGSRAQQ